MNIIDSHAHYDDKAFDNDRYELLDRLMGEGTDGVKLSAVVNVGCSAESSQQSLELSERYGKICFSAGLHPDHADSPGDIDRIERICRHKKCVAVGEIGLDYHYESIGRDIQKKAFEEQLKLSVQMQLPVIIHSRDACMDTMDLLSKYRPKGVIHCFSYSAEIAAQAVDMGMYIGFTGAATFKNAKKARRAMEAVPLDRLLCETDCPYMAPEPLRGKRCDSSMLIHTLGVFAQVKGITIDKMAEITAENAENLFGLKEKIGKND